MHYHWIAFVQRLAEREHVLEAVAEEAKGKLTLISHVGAVSTHESQQLAQAACRYGFDAVSAVTPFYYPFSFEEYCKHYRAIGNLFQMQQIRRAHPNLIRYK